MHGDSICDAIFINNGNKIITASADKTIKIWNIQTRQEEFTFTGHLGTVSKIGCAADEVYLATASSDQTIKVWNLKTLKEEFTLNVKNDINAIAISADGECIANSCKNTIQFWSLKEKLKEFELVEHGQGISIKDVIFIPNMNLAATAASDSLILLWDLESMKVKGSLQGHHGTVWSIALSPDGQNIASESDDRSIMVWNIKEEKPILTLTNHQESIYKVTYSPNGKYLASASKDKTIKIWDLIQKVVNLTLYGHLQDVWSVKFIKGGEYLISVSNDKTARVWDITKKSFQELHGHAGSILSLAVSPDEKYFATGSSDRLVKIWNIREMREEISFSGHEDAVSSVNFHYSGKFLVSSSDDCTIKVWNIYERREEYFIAGFLANAIAYSRDGKYLAGAGHNGVLKMWVIESSQNDILHQLSSEIDISALQMLDEGQTFGIKPNFQSFIPYYSVISHIKTKNYNQLSSKSIGIQIGTYGFTPLHYLAYLGLSKPLEIVCSDKRFIMKADSLGHSPLYYSIKKQHRKCTDILLECLITLGESEEKSLEFLTSFYSIRNALNLLIISSSKIVHRLLHVLMYPRINIIYSGTPISPLPIRYYSESPLPQITIFIKQREDSENQELKTLPLIIKTSHFLLPVAYGSDSSIKFLNTILRCTNDEIFRTAFIQQLIQKKWDDLIIWIYCINSLEWLNIFGPHCLACRSAIYPVPNCCGISNKFTLVNVGSS